MAPVERMARIAITMISSTRVKPSWLCTSKVQKRFIFSLNFITLSPFSGIFPTVFSPFAARNTFLCEKRRKMLRASKPFLLTDGLPRRQNFNKLRQNSPLRKVHFCVQNGHFCAQNGNFLQPMLHANVQHELPGSACAIFLQRRLTGRRQKGRLKNKTY